MDDPTPATLWSMPPPANMRWRVALLLGAGVLVNYFDRVNLSVAHDALISRFGITDVTFGYLLSAYSWTYAGMQLPCGALLDRWGVRRVMLVAVVLWAIASGLAAIAPTILLLFAARLLLGIGEAPAFPANAKAVGLWFAERERSIPTAIFDAAAKLSIGIGTPVLGFVLLRYGLKTNFATTAVLSLLYAGIFALVYRDPRSGEGAEPGFLAEVQARTVSLRDLLRQRKVLGAALGSGAYNYCFYLLLTWLPVYLERGVRLSMHNALLFSGLPWVVAAAADFLIGGLLIDALLRRGRNPDTVRRSVLLGGTALGLLVIAPAFSHNATVVLFCLSVAMSGLAAAAPVVWTIPSLLAPAGGVGRVGSILNFTNQIAAIVAPVATGYIRVSTHSFGAAFALAGVVLFFGLLSYIVLLGRIERVHLPGELTA
jgi:ACS family D-galactonate transporter-like MFS transporter